MAINLLEMVTGSLGQGVIGQIGGLLGESEENTGSAISAGLPAIIGGLMKQSSTGAGAQQVFDTASQFDGGVLDNIGSAIGGGNHTSMIETGSKMLGSILGGGQGGIVSSIAKMAGIGQGAAGSLLGLLAPIVMSALSKVGKSDNLDASGMASMLASQKDHLAAAAPKGIDLGLGDLLGSATGAVAGAAGAVGSAASGAASAVGDAASGAANTVGSAASGAADVATDTAKAGGGMLGKLLPLIVIGLLGWFGYQYFGGSAPEAPDTSAITDAAKGAMPNMDELSGKLTGSVGDMTTAIGGITDEASATASLDKLKGAAEGIGGLGLDSLPDAAKGPLAGVVGPLVEKLKGVLETAYAIPGVQGILEPIVGPVLETLGGIGG